MLLCSGMDSLIYNSICYFIKFINLQSNHGEDVKELYYYLDGAPDHTYMKALYRYPQSCFPYSTLREAGMESDVSMEEAEILDTGIYSHSTLA